MLSGSRPKVVFLARLMSGSRGAHQAHLTAIPFRDSIFDLVFRSWAMKNFMDPAKVLDEVLRVLKTGGTALIVDPSQDTIGQQRNEYTSARMCPRSVYADQFLGIGTLVVVSAIGAILELAVPEGWVSSNCHDIAGYVVVR